MVSNLPLFLKFLLDVWHPPLTVSFLFVKKCVRCWNLCKEKKKHKEENIGYHRTSKCRNDHILSLVKRS